MNIDASKCAKQVTLNVRLTGLGRLRVRLWMAKILIRLAVFAGGFGSVRFTENE